MDKERAAALATRGEQIKTNDVEHLWICRGIKTPLLPDRPITPDRGVNPAHLQLQPRPLNRGALMTRQRP
jgi:hypothetical protein